MQLPLAPWRAARVRQLDTRRASASGPVRGVPATPASPLPPAGFAVAGWEQGEVTGAAAAKPAPRRPSIRSNV